MSVSKLQELALEYRDACRAMDALWRNVLLAYPDSVHRSREIKAYNAGLERVRVAKDELLKHAREGASEIGQ